MAAIVTNSLTKRYGSTTAVDRLDLSVPEGTVYGFLGPNGAGKTTTMRMLTGLTTPTNGTATVADVPISNRDSLRPRIGYLPEEPPLYEQATAYEQLEYVAGLRDLPGQRTKARIDQLLSRLDLSRDDAASRIADYSKGMRQKVAYVQAVLHNPDVAFLDEPTAGLDPRAAKTIRDLIGEFTDQGTTVFLSTHILPVVESVADTVGILYDGRLVAEDSPGKLTKRAESGETRTLEEAFLELTSEDSAENDSSTTDG